MTGRSFGRRYWKGLTAPGSLTTLATTGRGRAGYSFWRRYWASFTGVDLPIREDVPAAPQAASTASADSKPRTRAFPQLVQEEQFAGRPALILTGGELDALLAVLGEGGPSPDRLPLSTATLSASAELRAIPEDTTRFTVTMQVAPALGREMPALTTIGLETGGEFFLTLMPSSGSATFVHIPSGEWTLRRLGPSSAKSSGSLPVALPSPHRLATLAAASQERTAMTRVVLPGGRAALVLHRERADTFLLEVIPDKADDFPRFVAVHYGNTRGDEQLLIIPFLRAGLARLPGYAASRPWQASLPAPADQLLSWDLETIAVSVRAAVNNVTRRAWRAISEHVPELCEMITEELDRPA
jgi:hypothetical protein